MIVGLLRSSGGYGMRANSRLQNAQTIVIHSMLCKISYYGEGTQHSTQPLAIRLIRFDLDSAGASCHDCTVHEPYLCPCAPVLHPLHRSYIFLIWTRFRAIEIAQTSRRWPLAHRGCGSGRSCASRAAGWLVGGWSHMLASWHPGSACIRETRALSRHPNRVTSPALLPVITSEVYL